VNAHYPVLVLATNEASLLPVVCASMLMLDHTGVEAELLADRRKV
jgi:hypothetical protein